MSGDRHANCTFVDHSRGACIRYPDQLVSGDDPACPYCGHALSHHDQPDCWECTNAGTYCDSEMRDEEAAMSGDRHLPEHQEVPCSGLTCWACGASRTCALCGAPPPLRVVAGGEVVCRDGCPGG